MKKSIFFLVLILIIGTLSVSCTDKEIAPSVKSEEGVPLNMYVDFDTMTRVGELPSTDEINEPGADGLQYIGLYIYYTDEYTAGDLSQPYVRNLKCEVNNGKLEPILADGESIDNETIYIYDNMTLVAFYPYNADMSLEQNYFEIPADEDKYPITNSDYNQRYIPYRGETTVNPTTAFFIQIVMRPKHTFRLEIILVSENESDFNDGSEDIRILPELDPVENTDPTAASRQLWVDRTYEQPNTGGGLHVRRYVAYIWTVEKNNPIIQRNDVLFENGDLTLLAAENVNVREQFTYRYGYNLTTGEIFIPTSSNLINDANSLQSYAATATTSDAYQVCDIDLSSISNFQPLTIINATYDGGGHAIKGLQINSTDSVVGLFRQILGNSNLKNVYLSNPVITVNNSTDSCYVGALCGQVNNGLTEEEKNDLLASVILPPNLAEVVKDALLQDLLADVLNSTSQIIACKVENPTITVNSLQPHVGTICGANGERYGEETYKGNIWDTYNLGGILIVNNGNPAYNADAYVGGFCGVNNYYIERCYTTIEEANISAYRNVEITNPDGSTTVTQENIYQGFAWEGVIYTRAEGAEIQDCYAIAPDSNPDVNDMNITWPSGWVQYTGIWPINTTSWTNYAANSFWYQLGSLGGSYPILQWERR